jgi:hypothetical protein
MTKKKLKVDAPDVDETPPEIVVQTKRGGCKPENRVPVSELSIPDLYNAQEALRAVAGQIRRDNQTGNMILDERARLLDRIADSTLEGWHLASDMRHCLQQTVSPAVQATLHLLYELRNRAERDAVAGKSTTLTLAEVDQLVGTLERTTKDGQHG